MSPTQHRVHFMIELKDCPPEKVEHALANIRASVILEATDLFGIKERFEGKDLGWGGYEGPFVTNMFSIAVDP